MGKFYTNEDFINKAFIVHGEKYDHSKINYIRSTTKIVIKCNICKNIFEQNPADHLTGHGCKQCMVNRSKKLYSLTTEEFITRAKIVHKEIYDYSLVKYVQMHTYVTLICNLHYQFLQTPHSHLKGQGCPKCNTKGNVSEPRLFLAIKKEFTKFNIISQGKPLWLKQNIRSSQSLDIYFPNENIGIEYQGIQHFKAVEYWGGTERFQYVLDLDERKRKLCEKNNCKLFYFSYERSYIPDNYPHKVYSDEFELITNIKNHLNFI